MATPDMDVIKEIPGYKVILKAVLKSQIQQLVEQLASHTDEESVILTASVSDGTLSHLGSDSGKSFLQDHEDMKSQFLGFCLKRHHKKKQEKEREEELQRMSFSPRHLEHKAPRYPPPRQNILPPTMARTSPGSHNRPPGLRHEPYPVSRPRRSLNMNPQIQSPPSGGQSSMTLPTNNQIVKIEPDDESSNQSAGDSNTQKHLERTSSQPSSPSRAQTSGEKSDKASDDTSDTKVPNEASDLPFSDTQPPEGLGLDSDFANLISGEQSNTPSTSITDPSGEDSNVKVKLEAISESDMELEITGVEPGRASLSSQDTSWAQMGYDASGATGNQGDLQGQEGYTKKGVIIRQVKNKLGEGSPATFGDAADSDKMCIYCNKTFHSKTNLYRHLRIHQGIFPYACSICNKKFSDASNYKKHRIVHMQDLLP